MSLSDLSLTDAQRDRAVGVLLATAAGNALGAGYMFADPIAADRPVVMIGGGLGTSAPGKWTDDTARAVAVAEIAGTGADLREVSSLDYIVERWHWWARNADDIGVQTFSVLAATAPVALAYLDDEVAMAQAARAVGALTHADPETSDACVLWCAAIRHVVLTGALDIRIGLPHIDIGRRALWTSRVEDAERLRPSDFAGTNGSAVPALQAAWSAIVTTPVPAAQPAAGIFAADHLRLALEAAVRGGGNTDTVAAIAGGLLGGRYGGSAVPWRWRLTLKGWPGLDTRGLARLAELIIDRGEHQRLGDGYVDGRDFAKPKRHPFDENVWLGAATSLHHLPPGVDAIVSLCRVVESDITSGAEHLDVRLTDQAEGNPNLDFVLLDTVRAIEGLRATGHTVFVHCDDGRGRALAVGALYGARRRGVDVFQMLLELSDGEPNLEFWAALRRLRPDTPPTAAIGPVVPPLPTRSVTERDAWWPYWHVLFPSPAENGIRKWRQLSTGVNIARALWGEREYRRRTYESVFGPDRDRWPSRHPGVVLGDRVACLGCQWLGPHGHGTVHYARRHEMSDGEFTG